MSKNITGLTTVAQIVTDHPQLRVLLEELNIDYCCNGKDSLELASQKASQPLQKVIDALIKRLNEPQSQDHQLKDWRQASLTELTDHVIDVHHGYLKKQFPRLGALLEKVYNAHKAHHGDMLEKLEPVFNVLRMDLDMRLEKEEQIFFPMIKQIDAFAQGKGEVPVVHCGTIENPIRQMEYEHDIAGDFLAQMRTITDDYRLPDDACQSFKALYEGLDDIEKDLHKHIHLENNILFPKSIELEKSLNL